MASRQRKAFPLRFKRYGGFLLAACAMAATPVEAQPLKDWSLDPGLEVAARIVSAKSAIRDDEEAVDGDAIALRIAPSVRLRGSDVTITLRNSTTRIEYFPEDRSDRWQNTARLTGDFAVGEGSSLTFFGERGDNLSTAEYFMTDEWEFGGRLEQELNEENRIRLGASWRDRSYDDSAQSQGSGPQIDGEYRYRLGANHFVHLRGRYEEIDSSNLLREMSRRSIFASYQRPIARDLRIRPEISYRDLDYPGRILATSDYRRDDILSPEVSLLYSPGPWLIIAEARYIARNSSDPEFDREGYRLALEVTHEF